MPERCWVPHAVGESARGEAAGGGGETRRKMVLKAEQQGADLLPGARSLVHGVSRLPVSWAPRSDPRSSHPSTRHLGAQVSPRRHSERGNSTENGDLLPAGCAPRTLAPPPGTCPLQSLTRPQRNPTADVCPSTDTWTDRQHSTDWTDKPMTRCVFPNTGGGAEPPISPPL